MRHNPKQFVVGSRANGDDFDLAEIEALIYAIALWFSSAECDRKYDDPKEAARKKVQECLLAETDTGEPWRNCPKDFHKRIRSKCSYDMEAKKGIPVRQAREAKRLLSKEAQEASRELKKVNPVLQSFDQDAFRERIEADIYAAFPELDNPAHRPNVRSLSGLYAQREVIDRELALGTTPAKRELLLKSLKMISDMADGTLRQLGVHPDQVRKKISDKMASTVADLVAMISEDEDYKTREKTWAQQLALQLYWMSEHYNGRKSGPQLHPFEIWHLTRSRPIDFKCRCGITTHIVEGFEPNELRDYLLKEGVLVEEPVLPIMDKKALEGLATADLTPIPHETQAAVAPPTQDGNDGDAESETGRTN